MMEKLEGSTQGYLHPLYAKSFSEIGEPLYLPRSKGWLIKRQIPGTPYFDAMGCYPLFSCRNWEGLKDDIEDLENKLVSISLVTDPFANINYHKIIEIFPVCYKFKDHFITDFNQPLELSINKKTRKHARRALRDISIEHCKTPLEHLRDWTSLYDVLIKRHNISGIRAFSLQSFEKQLSIPGVEMFLARSGDIIVGGEIFIIMHDVVYAHLVALKEEAYECNASYALDWEAINYFSKFFRFLDHGSGSGLDQLEDGLTLYKKRWSTLEKPVFFCGRILEPQLYCEITDSQGAIGTDYFPAYRKGEFM